jgi:protein TonB
MTSFRYGSSFIISSLLYGALGYSLFLFLEKPKKLKQKPNEKIIKIALITPKPKPIVKPKPPVVTPPKEVIKPKPKPKPKPKKVIKKVIKKSKPKPKPKPKKVVKKIKPKPKKVHHKKMVHKKVIKKKIVKKPEPIVEEIYFTETPIIEETVKYVEPQVIQAPPTPPKPTPKPKVDKSADKRAFLRRVRSQIKANKKYPKMALRRHIEGSVGVMFDIGVNGDVSNIRFLNGRSILQKSVRRAVTQSFPLSIPANIQSEFPMYNISVTINFKIR